MRKMPCIFILAMIAVANTSQGEDSDIEAEAKDTNPS